MVKEIILEWQYEPETFFENSLNLKCDDVNIDVNMGKVISKISTSYINNISEIIDKLNRVLESRFLAVQVMTHKQFILSQPSRTDLNEDGTRILYCEIKECVSISSMCGDIIVRDCNGNIISDTKKERVEETEWFSKSILKFQEKDKTLKQMLKSYSSAISDPANELVHLYEIRDAVSNRFGGGTQAKRELSITNQEWSNLGSIANNEPLLEGRHRGNNAGNLRPADSTELDIVRKLAHKMIKNYLIFLEKQNI